MGAATGTERKHIKGPRGHVRAALALGFAVLPGAGCPGPVRPDLERLYAPRGADAAVPPLAVIHGVLGARLADGRARERRPAVDHEALMLEPSDGTVTKASLLARQSLDPGVPRHRGSVFPIVYPVFLCAGHDRLTGNPGFRDKLLHALLSVDR